MAENPSTSVESTSRSSNMFSVDTSFIKQFWDTLSFSAPRKSDSSSHAEGNSCSQGSRNVSQDVTDTLSTNMDKHKKGYDVHSFDVQDGDQMLIVTRKSCRDHKSNWMEHQLVSREMELAKREAALFNAQKSMRKQNKLLRLDVERKDGEMAILQQKINFLVKSRVDSEEEAEIIKVQSKFNQSKLEQEIHDLKCTITDLHFINQQASDKNEEQQTQIDALQMTNKELDKQNQLLVEKSEQTSNAVAIGDSDAQLKVVALEEELDIERETCVELREQLSLVRQDLGDKVDNLEMQLQLEKMKYAQVATKLMDLELSGISSASAPAASQKHIEELQAAEVKVAEAEMHADQLSQALINKEEEIKESKKSLESLKQNLLNMNNQVVGLTHEVNDLQNRVRSKSGQLELVSTQLEHYREEATRYKQLHESAKQSMIMLLGYLGPQIVKVGIEFGRVKAFLNQKVYEVKRLLESRPVMNKDNADVSCILGLPQLSRKRLQYESAIHYLLQLHHQLQLQQTRTHVRKTTNNQQVQRNNKYGGSSAAKKCGNIGSISSASTRVQGDNHREIDQSLTVYHPSGPASLHRSPSSPIFNPTPTSSYNQAPLPHPQHIPTCFQKENNDNKKSIVDHVFIPARSRAILRLIFSQKPLMVWVRRLLMISAIIFLRCNSQASTGV